MQRALIQYRNPKLYDLVCEALEKAGRTDLIGYGPKCLVRPKNGHSSARQAAAAGRPGRGKMTSRPGSDKTSGSGSAGTSGKGSGTVRKKKKTIRNVHKKK